MDASTLASKLRGASKTPRLKTKVTIEVAPGDRIDVYIHELSAGGRDLLQQVFQHRDADETRAYAVALTAHDADGLPLYPLLKTKRHPLGVDKDGCPVFEAGVIDDLKAIGVTRLEAAWRAVVENNALGGTIAGATDDEGNSPPAG